MPPKKPGQPDLSGYQYSALSSIVSFADRRFVDNNVQNEPKGDAETLRGRIDPKSMGSRVQREQVKDLDKKKSKAAAEEKARKATSSKRSGPSAAQGNYADVLQATADLEGLRYIPRTAETREIYELILNIVHSALGDQTSDVVRSAADAALETLKDEEMRDFDKKKEIEDLVGELSSESFGQLVNLSKKITDYDQDDQRQQDPDADTRAIDEETGVAVLFDNEDDESDQDEETYVVREESDDDEDDGGAAVQQPAGEDDVTERVEDQNAPSEALVIGDSAARGKKGDSLSVHDIDPFWIQRLVATHYQDEREASDKANEAFNLLASEANTRDCENSLMELFDYENFDIVQTLIKHRDVIVWCTKLGRADEDEKVNIEVEMREKGLNWILKELRGDKKDGADGDAGKGVPMDIDDATKNRILKMTGRATLAPGTTAQPRKVVDLEAMAFSQGGHLNSNAKVRLPEGSFKRTGKGYEEIHVPAPTRKGGNDVDKVPFASLPTWAQPAFGTTGSLNLIQSQCYPIAFGEDEPMLMCAPTGAGKTNVAMLTILRELGKWRDEQTGQFDLTGFKIVYVAPMKALVAEQADNFRQRLASFGMVVNELTGDSQLTKQQIAETQVIVTTPEKWDVISRKSSDTSYTNLVRLMIIDEIHLLHDDRGPVLESIVARTIRRMEQLNDPVRLVGLSATLPNYKDVATFLRVNPKKGLFYFESGYRPCPLKQEYIGITEKKAIKRFQIMNEVCYDKSLHYVSGEAQQEAQSSGAGQQSSQTAVMIFVHSRKETAKTAKFIRDKAMEADTLTHFLPRSAASKELLTSEVENVKDANLRDLLPYGFGIHHAGMGRADRQLVEDLFAGGHIQVLVSTATLAWGVNLPAHTVIIKGTQIYNPEKGRWVELSPQDMLQMLGRAGRPHYDTFGEGIVITNHSELQYYLSLLNQQLPIESQFVSKLADNLNAEIVLGTIRNRDEAVAWLGYTYLYVRMLRTPALYSVSADYAEDDPFLEQKRADIIHSAAVVLEKCGLLRYERKSGLFTSNELGRIASHYYITHTSMATYHQHLKPHLGLIELFRIFALSEEFKYQVVRQDEKLEVGKLLERVPIPVKESLDDPAAKVNVLLQSWVSQLKLEGYVLAADMVYITQSAGRILRAIFEICLRRGYARLSHTALDLCKMVESRQWGSMTPLRQFKGVPADLVRRLERKEYPWARLRDLEPNEIGELIGVPKAGRLVHRLVNQFPRLELQAFFQPLTRSLLSVQLTLTPDFQWDEKIHGGAQSFHVLVEDVDGEIVLFHDTFLLRQRFAEEEHTINFTVPITDPVPPNYFISIVSDRWLQSEMRLPISFKNLILPEKFPPHTQLLDLQPQPVSALRNKEAQAIFEKQHIASLNRIQTQTYHAIYETDDSVLVGAPTGSGKTLCADLALLRLWNEAEPARAVCIVPYETMQASRVTRWQGMFGNYRGGKEIVALVGEMSADLRLLETADVVVATPAQWDVLSRRWRQRKNVRNIGLYIADEVQLLGDWNVGPSYETVLSRARFVAAQNEDVATRFLALTVPLGNARDVGDWLGCPSGSVFNFSPAARPIPMEVHLQSFNIPHFPSLMIAMAKPAYLAITEYAPESPILAFVPSRKQAKLTANDILSYALADSDRDGGESRFLNIEAEDLKPHLDRIQDRDLAEVVENGVAYYHEGLSRSDKRIVERLYEAGAIQVVVASKETAWSIPLTAHMVLVMSVQSFDGKEHRYVDYPITDVLQMVGRSTQRGPDGESSRSVLLCQASRKDFFKKFLAEGLPLESKLNSFAQDFFNAEIVARTVDNKQAAVDILTWTLMYRRLRQNPQAYNCQGSSQQAIGEYLSELVETTLSELENSKCVAIEDDFDVSPLNLGMISSFYNISYVTIDVFNMSLKERTKMKGLLEIVSSAAEFEDIPIRQHEDVVLRRLYDRLPYKLDKISFTSPYHKVFVLLQAHFARLALPVDLETDQRLVLGKVLNLLSACVDVMSSNAYLNAIIAMELSQMCVQAVWDRDSPLRQVPHFTADIIERCKAKGLEDVYALGEALGEMEEQERDELLQLSGKKLADVATFTNSYPYLEVEATWADTEDLRAGDSIVLNVDLSTADDDEEDEEEEAGAPEPIPAPHFPSGRKTINWWIVVGSPGTRQLLAIKRVVMTKAKLAGLKLELSLPKGKHDDLTLYCCSDATLGSDRQIELPGLEVAEGEDSDEDESEDDEDEEMADAE
ncbi:putative ATP dependent RNA helicase [Jaminaea rosea]|uniref:RNA helicase n=1 Tax=Jaminaea rosea TaxID=1569628 RepID=A0A316UZW1_9BASI|nr:putative ATP dependent RNA helicase [Jaminaea rosea]PWN30839.1 putative ATP dependent RNA helicase [Jaminaea rosea]